MNPGEQTTAIHLQFGLSLELPEEQCLRLLYLHQCAMFKTSLSSSVRDARV